MVYLILAAALILATILYFRKVYTRFDKYGIKYLKPIPVLGNMLDAVTRKRHIALILQDLNEAYPEERFTGLYDFLNSTIMLKDPEVIKTVMVKEFEYFLNRRALVDDQVDIFFGRNLFSIKGQEWKDMRSTLSPAFTSSKMRSMVSFMVEVNEQMISFLNKKIKDSESDYIDIECKDLMTRYANDVIASCAFGVKLDSHTEENNEFYKMGKGIASFGVRVILVVLGYLAFPALMKIMKIKLLAEKNTNFFKNLVMNNMKERELLNILRPDMIHLLMEAKKEWSDNDLIAQAILFFVAGFETVSTTLTFLLYELALNPEVQDRLFQEIKENDAKNGGKFDYNSIQNLKYMDMVVSEVLRLWPPIIALNRECVQDYNIGRPNDTSQRDYIVRKNESVSISVWSMHRDAGNFPDPEQFEPERFSEENKEKIKPFSYLPFGVGPRNCIGSRFALCEVKVMAYRMIQQLELSPCEKTPVPLQLDPNTVNIVPLGGTWIRMKARN